jgi:hypothetical protein
MHVVIGTRREFFLNFALDFVVASVYIFEASLFQRRRGVMEKCLRPPEVFGIFHHRLRE